jgi:hypothetical protein
VDGRDRVARARHHGRRNFSRHRQLQRCYGFFLSPMVFAIHGAGHHADVAEELICSIVRVAVHITMPFSGDSKSWLSAFNRDKMRRLSLAVYYRICMRPDLREPMRYRASDGNSVTTLALRSFVPEGDSSCRTQGNFIKERRVRVEKDYLSLCSWRASSCEEPAVAAAGDSVRRRDFRRT